MTVAEMDDPWLNWEDEVLDLDQLEDPEDEDEDEGPDCDFN